MALERLSLSYKTLAEDKMFLGTKISCVYTVYRQLLTKSEISDFNPKSPL